MGKTKTKSSKTKSQECFDYNAFYGLKDNMDNDQLECVKAILDPNVDIVLINSPAGTGKTTLSVAASSLMISNHEYDQLYYVFAPVEEGQMGYTPGDLFEKERKYHGPIKDALVEIGYQPDKVILDPTDLSSMKNTQNPWVHVMSHVFLRGINIDRKVVIIDEAQNFTLLELKKIITRIHDDCKLIIIGHIGQCDINVKNSGFYSYLEHAKSYERARIIHLTKNYRGKISTWGDEVVYKNLEEKLLHK